MKWPVALIFCLTPSFAQTAPTLALPPAATQTAEDAESLGSYALPVGPWKDNGIETWPVEGEVIQTAWRIRDDKQTTLALLAPLRDQLKAEDFDILYQCETDACGGFDFLYATDVLPEPEMHVDLGDFRFLSARRSRGAVNEYVSLLVSRSSDSGYLQMTRVGAEVSAPIMQAEIEPEAIEKAVQSTGTLTQRLDAAGSVVLDDLRFDTGSVALGPGKFQSLADLAAYLKANPDRRIALVGHTDAEGSLDANIALSRRRAQSVRQHLISDYGANPSQLSADGVGYLSPRATNMTQEGRTENRRVEAMITSTQ
ncbi:MAG: OmpA family protein [Rhodobacteraceae bacterium]|nr:OmpA family protein [Paracoccaceae bacterium]MCP5341548.1 OmpA family protein [Paracoccaceae bacterium]